MAKNPPRKLSAPALIGKLVGATVALPTAGLAYGAAAWQGLDLTTAIGRSVVAGLVIFFAVSIVTRILMHSLSKSFKPKSEEELEAAALLASEGAEAA